MFWKKKKREVMPSHGRLVSDEEKKQRYRDWLYGSPMQEKQRDNDEFIDTCYGTRRRLLHQQDRTINIHGNDPNAVVKSVDWDEQEKRARRYRNKVRGKVQY